MERYLYNAITKLYRTLTTTGTVNSNDKYKLYIIGALYSISKTFGALVTREDNEKFNKYIACLAENNCLVGRSVPCLDYNLDYNEDSLVTILNNDIITDAGGTTLVSIQRRTRTFNDFIVRSDIEADQYVVGYDQSANDEVAINVQDLGVFWDVDI